MVEREKPQTGKQKMSTPKRKRTTPKAETETTSNSTPRRKTSSLRTRKPQYNYRKPATRQTKPGKPVTQTATTEPERKITPRAVEQQTYELLPPHVSSWEITPSPVNPEQNVLIFYVNNEPHTYIEINENNLSGLMEAINYELLIVGAPVTDWYLRTPDDPNLPSILTLTSHGTVLSTLPLEEDLLKGLVPQLNKLWSPNKLSWVSVGNWVMNHKIASGFILAPFILILGYSLTTYFI